MPPIEPRPPFTGNTIVSWAHGLPYPSVGADDPVRPNDDRIIFDRADRVVGPYGISIDGITIHQTIRRARPYENKIHDPHILHFSLLRSIIMIY